MWSVDPRHIIHTSFAFSCQFQMLLDLSHWLLFRGNSNCSNSCTSVSSWVALESLKAFPVLLPDLVFFVSLFLVSSELWACYWPPAVPGIPRVGCRRCTISMSDSGAEGSARWENDFPVPLLADLAFSINTSCFQDISSIITKHDSIFSAIAERV